MFGYQKSLWMKGGVVITFLRKNFFASECRRSSWGTLQGFEKTRVSESFMHKKVYHEVSFEIFCSSTKKVVRETCVSEKFWYQKKILGERRSRVNTFFRQRFFVSQCRKFLRGKPSLFHKTSVLDKFYGQPRGSLYFCVQKGSCLTLQKTFV